MIRGKVKLFYLFFILVSLLIFSVEGFAVPAAPVLHTLTQPDGTVLKARQWGDENRHGWETVEGYTIVFDENLNSWTYAVRSFDGDLISSLRVVGRDSPPNIPKRLRPISQPQFKKTLSKEIKKGDYKQSSTITLTEPQKTVPPTGTANIPVILINYQDTTPTNTVSEFNTLLFGTGNFSMRDYYREVSYGAFDISAGPSGILGWHTALNTHAYYGSDDMFGMDKWPGDLVYEAVMAADFAGFNFAPYDQDGDCKVDVVVIVHQGRGEEESANPADIWSHRWSLSGAKYWGYSHYGPYTTNDTCPSGGFIRVDDYTIQPERLGDGIITVGVFAHEYGHVLGLPDLYDTDGSSSGIGNWSLMAGGSWNKVSRLGDRPSHLDPWSKYYLGWVTPQPVTGTLSNEQITQSATTRDIYMLRSGTPLSGEYFLVENRQKVGFDSGLPGDGLLIWHIDGNTISAKMSLNEVNNSECYPGGPSCALDHYGVRLVQADNLWELEKRIDQGDAGDPYPGSTNNTAFTVFSSPNSNLYNGTPSGVSITNISQSASTMIATLTFLNCTYSIDPISQSFPTSGGTGSVNVVTQSGCGWTAVSNDAWITITSGSSGMGSGVVYYSVSANTGPARIGTITIAGKTFTISQEGTISAPTNLLLNPGFESGRVNWVEYSSGNYILITQNASYARSGSWFAVLGGLNNLTEYIYQDVTIPSNAEQAYVQFWYRIATDETTTTTPYDKISVQILRPADNSILSTLVTLSNLNKTTEYVQSSRYDVSSYKGQTIRLIFYATTDYSLPTFFLIDDTALMYTTPQAQQHTLTVTKSGTGSGTVTATGCTLSWVGNTGTCTVSHGTSITLTATPDTGSTFAGWSGACSGTGTCQITMNSSKSVTATFNRIQHTLTVTKTGTGSGTVTATGCTLSWVGNTGTCTVSYGTIITLTATPDTGSTFAGWSGACSGTGTTCQITMDSSKSVTATFNRIQHTLTVTKTGTGSGTVTVQGCTLSWIGNTGTCTVSHGTSITLTATPGTGSTFAGWSGACSGTGTTCQITMDSDKSVTATFNLPPRISVSPKAVNLGAVKVGGTSAPRTVTVKNTGKSDLLISNVDITGTNASEFYKTHSCSTIPAGSSCDIEVRFMPRISFGKKSAIMTISSNDPKKPNVSVKLLGVAPPPKITVAPKAVNFGKLSESVEKIVRITNKGISDLMIDELKILNPLTNMPSSEFTIKNNNCTSPIVKDNFCEITLEFTPSDPLGKKSAILVIPSNDPKKPTEKVRLTGIKDR